MHTKGRVVLKTCYLALVAAALATAVGCETAPYFRQRGLELFVTGQYDSAEERFTKAAEKDPSHWASHFYLGLIHLKKGRPLEAQLSLELALSVHPADAQTPQILDALAEVLYRQNNEAALHGLVAKACDDFGTIADFLRQGKYLAKLGDADNAKIAFRKAAHFAPKDDPTVYLAMADFFESILDKDHAVMALRRALFIHPTSAQIQQRLRSFGVIPGPTIMLPPDEE